MMQGSVWKQLQSIRASFQNYKNKKIQRIYVHQW